MIPLSHKYGKHRVFKFLFQAPMYPRGSFLVRPCILHWLMGFRQIASLLIRLVQETLVHLLLSHQTIVFITIAFSLCWFCGFSSYFSSQCQFEREDDWWMPHFAEERKVKTKQHSSLDKKIPPILRPLVISPPKDKPPKELNLN